VIYYTLITIQIQAKRKYNDIQFVKNILCPKKMYKPQQCSYIYYRTNNKGGAVMQGYDIYADITERTQGDIYIGGSVKIVATVKNLESKRG